MKHPDCPYYNSKSATTIYCRRGDATGKIEGVSIENHIEHYCNGKYTQCRCYKHLEKSWGREKV